MTPEQATIAGYLWMKEAANSGGFIFRRLRRNVCRNMIYASFVRNHSRRAM
jgi:hypothetical protein